jgi:nucleoside-diphosphate-sugar epimerase
MAQSSATHLPGALAPHGEGALTSNPDSPHRTVLVLGATGHLGGAAVRAFAAAGWTVRAQVRRDPPADWPQSVQVVRAGIFDRDALMPAARDCAVIVNGLNPDYTRWDTGWPPMAEAVLALAEANGATLMLPGNVYNFGHHLPQVLREDTPFVGNHPKAQQRIALEADMAAAAQRGVRSIVIRAGDFLGGTGTWIDLAMARGARRGRFSQPGPVDQAHAWAYLPDLARTFEAVARVAVDRPEALAPHTALHFPGHTLTSAQLREAFDTAWRSAGGRPLRDAGFPWGLFKLLGLLPGRAGAMPRAMLEMRHLWQRPHRLAGDRLAALIGEVPHTPLAEVMRACVAALPEAQQPTRPAAPLRQAA